MGEIKNTITNVAGASKNFTQLSPESIDKEYRCRFRKFNWRIWINSFNSYFDYYHERRDYKFCSRFTRVYGKRF